MFAPRYKVQVGELIIEMGPPSDKSEVEEFAHLMSNPRVSRYLGRQSGFVPEDEQDWYDKIRADGNVTWLLFDVSGKERVLLGSSNYHFFDAPLRSAVSGFLIARPEYWGRGIAGHTHRVRTWHAFARDAVVCLRSGVFEPNAGSCRALESVGYVVVGKERNQGLDDGRFISRLNLECINPDPLMWDLWWHDDPVSDGFHEARARSVAALQWARQHVRPFEG